MLMVVAKNYENSLGPMEPKKSYQT